MKAKNAIGWTAILLAVLSFAPSLVPGVASVMGLLISLVALIISIFAVSTGRKIYFNITLVIVIAGMFLVNEALRVWSPLPMPINAKLTMYGLFTLVVLASVIFAHKLSK